MSIDDAFAKLVGRQASPDERERLYRVRDALGLHDNDAFWSIVMAFEYYDGLYRVYPAQLGAETRRCIDEARAAFATAAQSEAAHVQRMLSEQVAETSVQIARKLADKPVAVHWVATALAAVVAFGTMCVAAGYSFATAAKPPWVRAEQPQGGATRIATAIAALPAGWMVFALLVPLAATGARTGWTTAADPTAERGVRILGGGLVAGCVLGCIACVVMLTDII
ncbi:MAG: hypothetical protein ACRENE_18030 [Polyangiaceae bacterium]